MVYGDGILNATVLVLESELRKMEEDKMSVSQINTCFTIFWQLMCKVIFSAFPHSKDNVFVFLNKDIIKAVYWGKDSQVKEGVYGSSKRRETSACKCSDLANSCLYFQ